MGKGAAPEQKEAVQRNAICNLGMVKLFKFYYFLLKLLNFIREACQKNKLKMAYCRYLAVMEYH